MVNIFLKYIKKKIREFQFKKKWRISNSHNETVVMNRFPIDIVKVGKKSYGPLIIRSFGHPDEGVDIGNYVSIASDVVFVLGGDHSNDIFSTYPFQYKYFKKKCAMTKGKIVVEDDVWIGEGAMILSGVKIGQGAIVGARSVVAKDIPPYAIVVGNPGKIIKYRFSEEIIYDLLKINFEKITDEKILRLKELIFKKIDENNIKKIREILMEN